MNRRHAWLAAPALVWVAGASCDPCFGALSCRGLPAVSFSGHVIEHLTGRPVAGARVMFVRTGGVSTLQDTLVATSHGDGLFQLRAGTETEGNVRGDLTVTPPPPHAAYTVKEFTVPSTRTYGDGVYLGSLVVDPYYLFVGEVRDKVTELVVPNALVRFQRVGGIRAVPDTFEQTTDGDGRVFVPMSMQGAGQLDGDAIVDAPGFPRQYRIRLHLRAQYLDAPGYETKTLRIGNGLQYLAQVVRRGSTVGLTGVTLEFKRIGGISVQPDSLLIPIPTTKFVKLPLTPGDTGVLHGRFIVRPPAPYKTEVYPDVELRTLDGDTTSLLQFGFGTQVYARFRLRYRATGRQVAEGIQVAVARRSGLTMDPDGELTLLDSLGTLSYSAATPDTGAVVADLTVHLREPFDYDTFPGVRLPSRADSSATDFGILRVGRWIPWRGQVLDDQTGAPVGGAQVGFHRTAGVMVAPDDYSTSTAADGTFGFAAIPLRNGSVTGSVAIRFADTYRDTTFNDVTLSTSRDDTVRFLAPMRVTRKSP